MKIKAYYFSPTGGTRQVLRDFVGPLAGALHSEVEYHSYTLPEERGVVPRFDADDVIVWATPVYAGRIPNKTLDYVRQALHADGNPAVALVTFGNRAYDNALAELVALMRDGGMMPMVGAAVVTRHAFSDTLGVGRPSDRDRAQLEDFATRMAERIHAGQGRGGGALAVRGALAVPGEGYPEKYYTPLKVGNVPAGFLKAKPSCNRDRCTRCDVCAHVCPMGSIVMNDGMPSFDGICIKCQACRRLCPEGAIAFTDPEYLSHVAMIERTFAEPKCSEFYTI